MIALIPTPHLRQVCDSQSGLIAVQQWFSKIDNKQPDTLLAYMKAPGNKEEGEWRNVTCVRLQDV